MRGVERSMIPLDLNESYWLLDEETLGLLRNIPATAFSVYPEYSGLTEDIATYINVPTEYICLAPGSDEAIRAVVRYCAKRKYRALLILPTFSGYERVLMETPLDTARLYYSEQDGEFVFPLDETLERIRRKEVDVIFLCEPNNPLGTVLGEQPLAAIMHAAQDSGVLVVSDEAYGEFGGTSVIPYVDKQPVVVLRTLSKAFGVPGIRVGYTISSPDIVKELKETLFGTLPWIISGPSIHTARIVLSRSKYLLERKDLMVKERNVFSAGLSAFPEMTVFPSHGNFILMRHPRASKVAALLLAANIRVGEGEKKTWDNDAKKILHSTLRMAVPSPEHRLLVFAAIHKALDEC